MPKAILHYGLVIWLVKAGCAALFASEPHSPVLTNIAQIRSLHSEAVESRPSASVEGIVTLHVPSEGYLWIQDGDDGLALLIRHQAAEVRPGDRVAVRGKIVPAHDGVQLAPESLRVLGHGGLVEPVKRRISHLAGFQDVDRLVEVEDRVRRYAEHSTCWRIELGSGRNRLWLELPKKTELRLAELLDSTVRARGVCVKGSVNWGDRVLPVLLLQDDSSIEPVAGPASTLQPDYSLPVSEISSLASAFFESGTNQSVVRVQGVVVDQKIGEHVVIRDNTGIVFVEVRTMQPIPLQQEIDVWGTPLWDGIRMLLRNAVFSEIEVYGQSPLKIAVPEARPEELPLLTSISQVRELSAVAAGWNYPVEVSGVVTFYNKERSHFYLQSDGVGIHVAAPEDMMDLQTGDIVDVTGATGQGHHTPIIAASKVTLVGTSEVPEARVVTTFQLAAGQHDSQWVQVRGVVRSARASEGILQMRLSDPDGVLLVKMPTQVVPTNLLDAVVRVRGVCDTRFNERRQIENLVLWAPSLEHLHVEEFGVANPLDRPLQPISQVTQFTSRTALQRRMKISGVVTLVETGSFIVQDRSGGIQVATQSPTGEIRLGDEIMAAGFPASGTHGNVLRDAVFKVIGPAEMPEPMPIQAALKLYPKLHNVRVRLDARLFNHFAGGNSQVLMFQLPGTYFEARLKAGTNAAVPPKGSLLRVTGIYRVLLNDEGAASGFQILVPSATDIEILEQPSWWTLQRTIGLIAVMTVLVAATFIWNFFLRRKVEQQTAVLQQKEAKFRSLVEQSLVGVYIVQDGRFAYINPRLADIFGYTAEEMLLIPVADVVLPLDLPIVMEQLRRRLDGEIISGQYTFRGKRKDGSIVHLEVLGSRTEFDGRPAVLGTALDISERMRAEAELARASTLLNTLLENSPDKIYFKDRDSRFVCVSSSFAGFPGSPDPRLIIGKTDFDIHPEEHATRAFQDEQEIIRTGRPIIGKLEKENEKTWALTTKLPWRDHEGNIIGTFGISKDITAIKMAEDRVEYERGLFRALLDTLPDAIYFKDLESRFVRMSRSKVERSWRLLLARYREEHPDASPDDVPPHLADMNACAEFLIGKTDFDVYPTTHAENAFADEQEIIKTGNPIIGKLEKVPMESGKAAWILTTKMPWRDPSGNIVGTFGVSRDVTAIKEAEARLEAAQQRLVETSRLAGMAEVATDVLHNVGNVLNSVNVSCALAIDRLKSSTISSLPKLARLLDENSGRLGEFFSSDPRGQQVPKYISALAESLTEDQRVLVNELEQLSKHIDHIKQVVAMQQTYAKVAGVVEQVSATELVEHALQINSAALTRHDIEIRREFTDVPPVYTDRHKVLQILVNLIRNAKYAMEDNRDRPKLLTLRASANGNGSVKIQVIDNGVGIPAENLTRIFRHGFTTRQGGHGFGLHSSALAVRDLGGTLDAHSEGPGMGATFTLHLPCKPPEKMEKPQ